MSVKIDLHTHSYGSPDGGLELKDYREAISSGKLDYIAITDHNRIDIAQNIQKRVGDKHICVGEEITTTHGEIIGLYLKKAIPAGLSPRKAAERIKKQGGLVYIPHPFETVRSGMDLESLDAIADLVDIVETYNGRAVFQDKGGEAIAWVGAHKKVQQVASSDAHGRIGWQKTSTQIAKLPTAETLVKLLKKAEYQTNRVGFGILYPKLNRIWRLHT